MSWVCATIDQIWWSFLPTTLATAMLDATAAPATRRPKIGVLTISVRASKGEYEDQSGPAIETFTLPSVQIVRGDLSVDALHLPAEGSNLFVDGTQGSATAITARNAPLTRMPNR